MSVQTPTPFPLPDFDIGRLDPFVRIPERLSAAHTLPVDDRRWLLNRYADLREQWNAGLPRACPSRRSTATHGPATSSASAEEAGC